MKKSKFLSVVLLASSLLATGALTSCRDNSSQTSQKSQESIKVEENTITFKIQNENGEWQNYGDPQTIINGTVTLPTNPTKKYYTFRGWFLDTNWVNEFTNKDLKEGAVVYAYFVADEVNIVINGESQGTKDLIDVINGTYNPGEGLTFDGWYTDPDCKVKYVTGDPAKTLYAQSVAVITFNNGYEDVYTCKVKPNETIKNPAIDTVEVDGVTKTVEENNIVKSYMSSEDIYYLDENGNEVDFTKAITKNLKIKVAWKSPFLKYKMCDNDSGNQILLCLGNYGNLKGSDYSKAKLNDVPVISFPSKVTLQDSDGNKTTHDIKGVYIYDQQIFNSTALKKVIVQEGIKFIRGFSSVSGTSTVTSFELPSTLKIMQDCFNNLNITKDSVTIPSGVEAIYDCFFKNAKVSYNNEANTYYTGTAYDFDINVPDSVKSLSIVPLNLKFSSNSSFTNDGDMITQNTTKGKVLISYNGIDSKGVINVPEGIEGIQVGTFVNRSDIKKLILPKTFKFVNYNLNLTDYQDCYGWYAGSYTCNECYLYSDSATLSENDFAYNARLVVSNLDTMDYLVFQNDYDSSIYKAFGGNSSAYAYYYGDFSSADNEVYKDIKSVNLKETTTPKVKVNFYNEFTDESYSFTIERENQNAITYDEILQALDTQYSTTYKSLVNTNKVEIKETLNMLEDYDMTSQIKTNLYLDIKVDYIVDKAGITYSTDGNEAKITGFDQESAISLGDDSYAVIIPDVIDGKKVTTIDEGAFKEIANVKIVKLGSNVTKISKNAFKDAITLERIDFNNAKLNIIGESAFENTAVTSLSFSIASLTSVGNSAFKTTTLKKFIPVSNEENRNVTNVADGEFYFVSYQTPNESWTALIDNYVVLNQKVSSVLDNTTNYTIYDVKMYAFCNGFDNYSSIKFGEDYTEEENPYVVRYEVMTGVITELKFSSSAYIEINSVSKIHTNAITSSTFSIKGVKYNATLLGITSSVSTVENLVQAIPTCFEEGWVDNYETIKSVKVGAL